MGDDKGPLIASRLIVAKFSNNQKYCFLITLGLLSRLDKSPLAIKFDHSCHWYNYMIYVPSLKI